MMMVVLVFGLDLKNNYISATANSSLFAADFQRLQKPEAPSGKRPATRWDDYVPSLVCAVLQHVRQHAKP
jgi:hypothetical protein